MRQVSGKAATPRTRLVELPGRGVMRVWECAGPRGAQTLMLIHGVTFTAELNWGKHFAPSLSTSASSPSTCAATATGSAPARGFGSKDCADDIAALGEVLGLGRFVAVGYSMGGMVAQLLYRRHPSLLSGLVLCATARNVGARPRSWPPWRCRRRPSPSGGTRSCSR